METNDQAFWRIFSEMEARHPGAGSVEPSPLPEPPAPGLAAHDLWASGIESLGGVFVPEEPEAPEPGGEFPQMLYRMDGTQVLVLDEEELRSAEAHGFAPHPSLAAKPQKET